MTFETNTFISYKSHDKNQRNQENQIFISKFEYIPMLIILSLLLTRKEKEELVIKLAKGGKTTREIAAIAHISLKDIGVIIKKFNGEEKNAEGNKTEQEEKERLKKLSPYAQAFHLFKKKKRLTDIVITLDLDADTIMYHYQDYLRLNGMDDLAVLNHRLGKDLYLFIHLFNRIKKEGLLNREEINKLVQTQRRLRDLSTSIVNYENYIENLKMQESMLIEEIENLSQDKSTLTQLETKKRTIKDEISWLLKDRAILKNEVSGII